MSWVRFLECNRRSWTDLLRIWVLAVATTCSTASMTVFGGEPTSPAHAGTNVTKGTTQSKPKSVLRKFESKEMDDVELREQLKYALALAERHKTKTKVEMDEYRSAIAELTERIAKGPTVSERFEQSLEKALTFHREQGRRSKSSQAKWTFELDALIETLRSRTPDGPLFCETEFVLSPQHAATTIGGVRIDVLLPYAKMEISHSPPTTEFHRKYLRALIVCATDLENDVTEDWMPFLDKMEWEKKRFKSDVANLQQSLKKRP